MYTPDLNISAEVKSKDKPNHIFHLELHEKCDQTYLLSCPTSVEICELGMSMSKTNQELCIEKHSVKILLTLGINTRTPQMTKTSLTSTNKTIFVKLTLIPILLKSPAMLLTAF